MELGGNPMGHDFAWQPLLIFGGSPYDIIQQGDSLPMDAWGRTSTGRKYITKRSPSI
jgi:hypothetical protein